MTLVVHRRPHGCNTVGDETRPQHQAGAKDSRVHTVAGTAAVEIDFIVTGGRVDPRGFGQGRRLAPAQLQGDRALFRVEAQLFFTVGM